MMNNEIMEIIRKNIPSQTADALKEFVSEAERNKSEISSLNKKVVSLEAKISSQEALITELKRDLIASNGMNETWMAKESELAFREKELFQHELEKKIYMLECERNAQSAIIERDMEIMNTVFRNPKFVRSVRTEDETPVFIPTTKDKYDCDRDAGRVEKSYTSKTTETTDEVK